MKVTIKANELPDLALFTNDEQKEIIQNILCILKTAQGSCPGLRDYGMDPEIYHKPIPVAKAAFSVSITRQVQEYEPRATITKLEFEDDPEQPSVLSPILEVMIP